MSNSYQHEIPLSRVNITLDVETGGARTKKELPMKLLMIGNYSHGNPQGTMAERERVSVSKSNFNQVLASFSPQASLTVKNHLQPEKDELPVTLTFKHQADFKPERIVEQVPALKRLMAMRNLLKDLKSCVIDNQQFRRELEKVLKGNEGIQKLMAELTASSPMTSVNT